MNVSIIIATYGEEVWRDLAMSRAYPSACDQRYRYDDINDAAPQVCAGHYEHLTIAQARNTAALGTDPLSDWLCFLDADDELAPGYLDAMKRALEQERLDGNLLLTPAVSYVTKGRRRPAKFPPGTDITNDNFLVVGTLIQRDLFFKVGGFSDYPHGFEDWSLWAKAWKAGARIVQVKHAIYIAYIDPNSEHRRRWRDRDWQVNMHNKVRAELFG